MPNVDVRRRRINGVDRTETSAVASWASRTLSARRTSNTGVTLWTSETSRTLSARCSYSVQTWSTLGSLRPGRSVVSTQSGSSSGTDCPKGTW
jgi:hypothetical protein